MGGSGGGNRALKGLN